MRKRSCMMGRGLSAHINYELWQHNRRDKYKPDVHDQEYRHDGIYGDRIIIERRNRAGGLFDLGSGCDDVGTWGGDNIQRVLFTGRAGCAHGDAAYCEQR